MSYSKNILISGAGVAGPAVALLLTRAGHKCTIVERAPDFRASGQQIDISGEALKVVKLIGIYDDIWNCRVEDDGIKFVSSDDKEFASFPVEKSGGWVKEVEILRPDLANILYDRTKDKVDYIFDDTITAIDQHETGVNVKFAKTNEREFALIIAADGLRSRTRDLAFESDNTQIVSLGLYVGYFDVPWQTQDGTWTKALTAPKGRCLCMRPNPKRGLTSAYICQVTEDCAAVAKTPAEEQRQELINRFSDVGWETGRVIEKLQSDDGARLYLQEIAQTKCKSWVSDRVVLLGDAGYAPSPMTGQGTTLALIGAYILAGCIATYPDHRRALDEYRKQVAPFVDTSQKLLPGIPWIINPQTSLGVNILKNFVWLGGIVVNSRIASALGKFSAPLIGLWNTNLQLPDYPAIAPAESEEI